MIGLVFTLITGTLLHFTYEWSGNKEIISFFSPINESTWEHLKLVFFPVIIFGILEYFAYGKHLKNFIPVKVFSSLLGIFLIIAIFYTYTGIIGTNYFLLDLLTFIIAVIASYMFSIHYLKTEKFSSKASRFLSYALLILFLLFFILFTVTPPEIALFKDPNNGTYGRVS